MQNQSLIQNAYEAFNVRNIDAVLSLMHVDVRWPNGWEGGYIEGHNLVRDYWKRQWQELDPHVEPISLKEKEDGRIDVEVHQLIKNLNGELLFDGIVHHIYTIETNLIKSMEILNP